MIIKKLYTKIYDFIYFRIVWRIRLKLGSDILFESMDEFAEFLGKVYPKRYFSKKMKKQQNLFIDNHWERENAQGNLK